jgi:hypothetical protein
MTWDPNLGLRTSLGESPLAAAVVDGRNSAVSDAALLHAAADTIPDAAGHDELHAAGAFAAMVAGEPYNAEYLNRWLAELLKRHR